MLSVLIPVYNFNVVPFVTDLARQCSDCNIAFEIICLDDFSDASFKAKNSKLSSEAGVVYEELPENVGRSKIRNRMSEMAKYDNLLFLDCDSKTNNQKFISNYIAKIDGISVVYGGRNYDKNQPKNNEEYFRWWYGVNRETINSEERKKAIYSHFMTNNFCIPKHIYQEIKLDETIKGYGHEDTLFGIELKQKGVPIIHIENPLCHIGLEDFETFIKKTQEGIGNLSQLLSQHKVDESIKLVKGYRFISKMGLSSIVLSYWSRNKIKILKKLQKENSNLKGFDFYKLGYLLSLRKSSKN
ncbi:MAG: glycosyltransferase [Vicingaceae bacterium]|nr:glycosyltransferase [Vicingaceae bacterium]